MVLREQEHEPFYIKIDGKWCQIDDAVLKAHPGGSAITTYKNMDVRFVGFFECCILFYVLKSLNTIPTCVRAREFVSCK